ncbi:hypothetical protein H4Q26_004909 [Puccinia striiformis f. sp. tritici PST-130]|nr:hypothetical protein H4Q26_004909 [Puccinia striiformis f. sp. tritici PST-130]
MSKIKEAIDQQTEWYGIDTFAGLEELDQPTNTSHQARPTTRKVEKFVGQSNDGTGAQSQTTTTVTIEPLELYHTILMSDPEHHYQPVQQLPPPSRSEFSQHATFIFLRNSKTPGRSAAAGGGSKTKSNKKKKIHYESKATRTIERVKKQAKHDSKSSPKKNPIPLLIENEYFLPSFSLFVYNLLTSYCVYVGMVQFLAM